VLAHAHDVLAAVRQHLLLAPRPADAAARLPAAPPHTFGTQAEALHEFDALRAFAQHVGIAFATTTTTFATWMAELSAEVSRVLLGRGGSFRHVTFVGVRFVSPLSDLCSERLLGNIRAAVATFSSLESALLDVLNQLVLHAAKVVLVDGACSVRGDRWRLGLVCVTLLFFWCFCFLFCTCCSLLLHAFVFV
jgi:hypothetical protein